MSVTLAAMPTSYDTNRNQVIHESNARLIRENDGQVFEYKDLPRTAQLAIAQYMAIDGEAWEVEPHLDRIFHSPWMGSSPKNIDYKRRETRIKKTLEKYLHWYIEQYGHERYGLVYIPTQQLIGAVTETCRQDDPAFEFQDCIKYRSKSEEKHNFCEWASILSCFPDETLQDGWTRFFNGVRAGKEKIECVWYPGDRKEDTEVAYAND